MIGRMKDIPKDPAVCLSFVNTQLRDHYKDLDDLCSGFEIDKAELMRSLEEIGYIYNEQERQFR